MIYGAPKEMLLAIDLHEDLVQMPPPLWTLTHRLRSLLPDLRRKHRPETVPPMPYAFMTDIDLALVQKIFDISQRQRKSNIHHHCEPVDFW